MPGANERERGEGAGRSGPWPFVTVIVPVRNEERHIEACLERILAQDYPRERLEAIVVDGASDDATREVVRRVAERAGPGRVRLLDNPDRIVPTALNLGIRAAHGTIVVRMDGHTVPAHDYVRRCVEALERSGAANVGGPMVPRGDTPFGEAVARAQSHPLGVGDAKFHLDPKHHDAAGVWVDTVYLGAFRREIFGSAGLFDESMVRNQDYEMNVRIRKAGGRILLDPAIRSTYTPRGTPRGLWRQYFQYGWWRVETIRRHPGSARWRQLLPPAFALSLTATALALPLTRAAVPALAFLAVPYALVVGAASWPLARRDGLAPAARFALAVVTMHLGYGFGFALSLLSAGRFPFRARPPAVPALASPQAAPRPTVAGSER